jgi:hypothetical protein
MIILHPISIFCKKIAARMGRKPNCGSRGQTGQRRETTMYPLLFALPLVLTGMALFILLVRALGRAWSEHRFRMALLEKLEHRPNLAQEVPELLEMLDRGPERPARISFTPMGVTLVVLGIVFLLAGQRMGVGRWAAGLYFGGAACIPVGLSLILAGAFLRALGARPRSKTE